ncbi:hypothetical protein NQ314_017055 [Rhamnusium bicolor]|uniref:DDE Tnp4 domain-containing protein n=1 Tax=Rhamnusium bicolor TaxID=1586634 RepID=A0AAV8WTS5_9CUCU|nr:hypothetical protein NQ314_017055 [Rhamnusium bicolor]
MIENVFGFISAIFRVFKKPMLLQPNTVSQLTMACVLLHNFLRRNKTSGILYTPPGTLDMYENGKLVRPGSWRQDAENFNGIRCISQVARKPSLNAVKIREKFTEYFYTNNSSCEENE